MMQQVVDTLQACYNFNFLDTQLHDSGLTMAMQKTTFLQSIASLRDMPKSHSVVTLWEG